jgi:hypothetical protein
MYFRAIRGQWNTLQVFPSHRVMYSLFVSLPVLFSNDAAEAGFDFTDEEHQAYWELSHNRNEPDHCLLGNPRCVQRSPEWDCVVESHQLRGPYSGEMLDMIRREMPQWQFLFQIDSDADLDVMWGDVGTLYVCILKERLKQRRFEDCMTIMQCS